MNPQDYQTLFRLRDRASLILNSFLLSGPLLEGEPLILQHDGYWSLSIRKDKEPTLANIGLDLFSDQAKFSHYSKAFHKYLDYAQTVVIPKYQKGFSQLNTTSFGRILQDLEPLWRLYGYTEMVFHDSAQKQLIQESNKSLERNLEELNALKLTGRKVFNAYVMQGGILDHLMSYFGSKYLGAKDDTRYLLIDELTNLLQDIPIEPTVITQRHNYYVAQSDEAESPLLYGKAAEPICRRFDDYEQAQIRTAREGILRGMTANPGKARGRVIIGPMLDLAKAQKVAARMKNGDILMVQSTNPDLMMLCHKAGAIVTNQGGVLSHAAIICRELGIPCIVGTTIATKVFEDGDLVEVDADLGIVRRIN